MGNHRADRRGPKRAAVVPPPARTPARRAAQAPEALRTPASVPTTAPVRAPVPAPVASHVSHAAPTRTVPTRVAAAGTRAAGGKRKATRRQPHLSPARLLPSMPTVVGAVAILAAAGGAVTFGQGQLPGSTNISLSAGQSDVLNGTDAFSFSGNDPRAQAISRDSERQAAQDKANQALQATTEQQAQQRDAKLVSLAQSAEKRADQIAKNLWVLPTIGYHLTARFGQASGLWSHFHTGLDFAAPTGTPIFAIANGVITDTGFDGAYGNKTVETLPDGTEIWYAHQSEIGVTVGEQVTQSEQIGRIGSTGNVTGPHVHIEVRPGGGDPVDPYPAFLLHGVTP